MSVCMGHLTRVTPEVSVEYQRYNRTNQKSQAHRDDDDHRGVCKQQEQTHMCAGDQTADTIVLLYVGPAVQITIAKKNVSTHF